MTEPRVEAGDADWKAIAIHWHQESCACSDPVGHMESEATMENEPKVEAGDRALEKPLEPNHHWKWFRAVGQEECPHKDQVWHKMEPELCRPCFYALKTAVAYADLIQSAMNAQEREIARLKKLFHDLTPGGSEFVNDPDYCAAYLKERSHMQHEIAKNATIRAQKAERLLAERGEGR